tara:strand:- start:212 stop:448 length:237 start_codon:yes stop_codon:yes gene_type:complete
MVKLNLAKKRYTQIHTLPFIETFTQNYLQYVSKLSHKTKPKSVPTKKKSIKKTITKHKSAPTGQTKGRISHTKDYTKK